MCWATSCWLRRGWGINSVGTICIIPSAIHVVIFGWCGRTCVAALLYGKCVCARVCVCFVQFFVSGQSWKECSISTLEEDVCMWPAPHVQWVDDWKLKHVWLACVHMQCIPPMSGVVEDSYQGLNIIPTWWQSHIHSKETRSEPTVCVGVLLLLHMYIILARDSDVACRVSHAHCLPTLLMCV